MEKGLRKVGIKKRHKEILTVVIAIIYISVFVIVAFKYINANRYWEVNGFDSGVTAESGQDFKIRVRIKNKMYYVLGSGDNYFISYHLYDEAGKAVQFENPRTTIEDIAPGQAEDVELQIRAPMEKGKYSVEIDIVKEDDYWFKDRGENPGVLQLTVN